MILRTLALFALTLLLLAGRTEAAPTIAATPAKSTLLRDDPLLQQKITLEATDRPLGDVLKALSPTLKADLTASSQIADQRVTLRLTDQPLYLLMNRLPQLLSHEPGRPHGYYWEKRDGSANARPTFHLWRDLRSILDEQRELDYPRREAAVLLRDLRNLAQLTPEQRAKYQGDFPYTGFPGKDDPFNEALKGLSDEQLDALLDGTKIALDPTRFVGIFAAEKQKQRDEWKRSQKLAALNGFPDPYPHGFPEQPDVAPVLSVAVEDREGNEPNGKGLFDVSLTGISYRLALDVYDTNQNRSPDRDPLLYLSKPPPGSLVDLTPLLSDKSVTPKQHGDLGFTLQALAKAAHLNIYQEAFLKEGATQGYATPGPKPLKGTLPQVIAGICAEWNCHAEKVGDDYLFWSRTWAWDRAADIPDRIMAPWQARFQKQGGLTLADDVEIASALIWPQIATLSQVLPEGCPANRRAYTMLRLVGPLSPAERDAAWSVGGLPLAGLSPEASLELVEGFGSDLAKVPGDQLDQAVLKVEAPPPGMTERMVGVNVQSSGETLFGAILETDPPPTAPSPDPSRS